jgi:hypothetical protein
VRVSKCYEEVASRESIEVIIYIPLDLWLFPDLILLSGCNSLRNVSVEITLSIHVSPDWFSVIGIGPTSIALLTTIVNEGNTSWGQREDQSAFEAWSIRVIVKEPRVIVIVDEDTKSINIIEGAWFLIIFVSNLIHTLTPLPNISDSEIHGIVKYPLNMVLVRTNIVRITIEAFSHLEDTCWWSEFRPEVFGYFRECINSNTVKVVLLYKVLNPILQILPHIWILLIQIWEARETTVLNLVLIVPVVNVTISVIVRSLIERIDFWEIIANWSNMVGDNINHNPDIFVMSSFN